jgi:ACDE family multidrug resistance protein
MFNRLLILALCGFVTSFGAHIVAVNLPTYAEVQHIGAFMIGLLIGVYDFAELFAKPVAGFLADRYGMKRTLLVGLCIFVVGSLIYLILPAALLLLVRFVQGLGAAALSTVSIALVARYFADRRGRAFGIYNAIKGAGYVIAPAAGGFIVQQCGFAMIFIVAALVGIAALFMSLLLPSDRAQSGELEDEEELSFKEFLLVFREPRLLPTYAVIFVNMFLVGILFGFLPVYLHEIGYAPLQYGAVVSTATMSYLLVQPLAGYLADKIEVGITVVIALAVAAMATAAVVFSSGALLIGIVILCGIGTGTVWTNTDALVGRLAKDRELGASMGAAQSFKELGDMVGPVGIGLLTQVFGIRVGFVTCAALALLLLIPLMLSSRFNFHGAPAVNTSERSNQSSRQRN